MRANALAGVYAITDPSLHQDEAAFLAACEAAMKGGIRLLQYRHKGASFAHKRHLALALQQLSQTYQVPLIINDDMQLAYEVGAQGVHLGQGDGDPQQARTLLGPDAIIGVTCHHDLSLADKAIQQTASYVAFGRFFASSTKPQAPAAPLAILSQARQRFPHTTLVAIGGITTENATQVLDAGAHTLAVAHGLFSAHDIEQQAQTFVALTQTTKRT